MYTIEPLDLTDIAAVYKHYELNKILFAPRGMSEEEFKTYLLNLMLNDIEILAIKHEDTILVLAYAFHRLGHIEVHCSILDGYARQIFEIKEQFINEYGADKNLMFVVPYDSRAEAALDRLSKRLVVEKVGTFKGYYGNNDAIIYQNKRV